MASPCYTHFTSPIRRYPDTTVHRLLRTYLFHHDMSHETIHHWQDKLVYVSDKASACERAAVDCEREVDDMKNGRIYGGSYWRRIRWHDFFCLSFGMFVELENMIEGLVPIRDMNDYFIYDEERMTLTGEKSHIKYTIGDKVRIKVVRASKEEKTIDFEIIKKL